MIPIREWDFRRDVKGEPIPVPPVLSGKETPLPFHHSPSVEFACTEHEQPWMAAHIVLRGEVGNVKAERASDDDGQDLERDDGWVRVTPANIGLVAWHEADRQGG